MGNQKNVLYFRNMFVLVTPVHAYGLVAGRGDIFIETDIGAVYRRYDSLKGEIKQRAIEAYHRSRTFEVSGLLGVIKGQYEPVFRLDATTHNNQIDAMQMRNAWMCARKHLFITTDQLNENMRIDRINDKDAVEKLQLITGWE